MKPHYLRAATWATFFTATTVVLSRVAFLIESNYDTPIQPDIGVGPLYLQDKWLTNRLPEQSEMALGTRFYIVLTPSTNVVVKGNLTAPANFRTYPWVILPAAGQTFSNCTWNINIDAMRYWQIRGSRASALAVLAYSSDTNSLPKF